MDFCSSRLLSAVQLRRTKVTTGSTCKSPASNGRRCITTVGRISRYVANKCSLAARIDNFATTPCNVFGEKMRDQVKLPEQLYA